MMRYLLNLAKHLSSNTELNLNLSQDWWEIQLSKLTDGVDPAVLPAYGEYQTTYDTLTSENDHYILQKVKCRTPLSFEST